MAASIIGSLRVALGLDTASFESGAASAEKRARQLGDTIGKNIRGGLVSATNALELFGVSLGAAALIGAAKNALDYASSLGEVAQQLGVTTKDLQVYRFAASQVGVSQEEMDKGLSKLTLSIGQAADGAKKQATTFNDLGINVRDAGGNIRDASSILPQLADALAQVKDPATRARIEVELFGKTGQKLDTLLAGGSAAIDQLTTAAEKAGVVLSPQLIQNADDAADKLSAVKLVLEANIAAVVAENAGAIVQLGDSLLGLIGRAREAANAWRVFMLTQRVNLAENTASGWFVSNETKLKALQEASDLRGQINDIVNPKAVVSGKAGGIFGSQSNPLDVRGALGGIASGRQASGLNAIAGEGGKPKKTGGGRSGKSATEKEDDAIMKGVAEARFAMIDMAKSGLTDVLMDPARTAAAERASAMENSGLGDIVKGIDDKTDLKLINWEDARREQDRFFREGEEKVQSLGALFEDALTGRAGSFWDNFRSIGMQVVTQIAARLLTNNGGQGGGLGAILNASSGSVLGGLLGKGGVGGFTSLFAGSNASIIANSPTLSGSLPKLARGGTIGGFGGIDRNLLSINGMPTAMVGRGERLTVEPNNDNRRDAMIVTVDKSPLFDVHVQRAAAPLAQAAQIGAVGQVEQRAARRARTRL